ncbi:hypothetical protein AIOL_002735 [Candidatus Rhodobacter oscarellae]|uniref:Uncharacterized protein n=1 Tax=Candidatus Rhodobacter oscarellae TaxID=1675527 RepID=A0A0J9E4U6_9RHOB|nr:hypothetical protein AIOL_002735 [Candidatus Rhodobacter lobularis]
MRWKGGIKIGLPNGFDSLKSRVEHSTCCPKKRNGTYTVSIGWIMTGDQQCGKYKTGKNRFQSDGSIHGSYGVNCQALRAQGLCGQ